LPLDGEQGSNLGLLVHAALEAVDHGITLLGNLVFDLKDLLPLLSLFLLQGG